MTTYRDHVIIIQCKQCQQHTPVTWLQWPTNHKLMGLKLSSIQTRIRAIGLKFTTNHCKNQGWLKQCKQMLFWIFPLSSGCSYVTIISYELFKTIHCVELAVLVLICTARGVTMLQWNYSSSKLKILLQSVSMIRNNNVPCIVHIHTYNWKLRKGCSRKIHII